MRCTSSLKRTDFKRNLHVNSNYVFLETFGIHWVFNFPTDSAIPATKTQNITAQREMSASDLHEVCQQPSIDQLTTQYLTLRAELQGRNKKQNDPVKLHGFIFSLPWKLFRFTEYNTHLPTGQGSKFCQHKIWRRVTTQITGNTTEGSSAQFYFSLMPGLLMAEL